MNLLDNKLEFHKHLAEVVLNYLEQQSLVVKDLHNMTGLPISTIRSYINPPESQKAPSFWSICCIARALHISLDELAGFETSTSTNKDDIIKRENEQMIHCLKLCLKYAENVKDNLA